ncbi:MAG: hypothetical protein EBS51_07460 [Planctomycetia bacterium]|nr:hypothetical protein [Planctomycetia bacterium]
MTTPMEPGTRPCAVASGVRPAGRVLVLLFATIALASSAAVAVDTETATSLNELEAQALVRANRAISLRALRDLKPNVAAILAMNRGGLTLDSIRQLPPETAQALAANQSSSRSRDSRSSTPCRSP